VNKKSPLNPFLSLLLLSMLLATPYATVPVQATSSWNIQTIDEYACSSGYGTACPIAIDSKNITHIAYTAYTSVGHPWRAVYASWNGSTWNKQTLAEDSFVQCLALDANDNPHILYFDPPDHLEYASWTGTSWTVQNTGIQGTSFALALDPSGSPHIAYTEGDVKYASISGKTWNSQTLDSGTELISLSIAVDSNNKPYILYSPSSYADFNLTVGIRAVNVKVATYQNSSWNIQAVPLPPPTGDIGNIVVDSEGYPHFICTQHHYVSSEDKTVLSTILYASWDGDAWETQVVVRDVVLQSLGQLVLDANDNPHFTYLTPASEGKTKSFYTSWTGKAWDIQMAETEQGQTACGSLALDANGNPHISCRGASRMRYTTTLLYATATTVTQATSPTVSESLILTVVTIVVGIGLLVYFKKRKHLIDPRV
jgi:hypothetical protein